jgi:hypothetical protein
VWRAYHAYGDVAHHGIDSIARQNWINGIILPCRRSRGHDSCFNSLG